MAEENEDQSPSLAYLSEYFQREVIESLYHAKHNAYTVRMLRDKIKDNFMNRHGISEEKYNEVVKIFYSE